MARFTPLINDGSICCVGKNIRPTNKEKNSRKRENYVSWKCIHKRYVTIFREIILHPPTATEKLWKFSDDPMVNTDFPVKRYTAVQYTQPAAAISPLSKSTRHLLVPEPDPRYFYTHRAHQETITIDRDNLKHGKTRDHFHFIRPFSPIDIDII